jgi:hypothetical protein
LEIFDNLRKIGLIGGRGRIGRGIYTGNAAHTAP